ncbi:MAG: phytase [Chloroflexales bacterium]|nr:phytase [Chloroflexales bacterium]
MFTPRRTTIIIVLALATLLAGCGAAPATQAPTALTSAQPSAALAAATVAPTEEAPTTAPTEAPTTAPTFEPAPEPEPVAGVPVVLPALETQPIIDSDEAPEGARFGDADDPAIWVHPTDPSLSLVAVTLKEGGLEVYDLSGKVLQSIQPEGVRYNNIDLAYGFELGGEAVDLFVATDRFKDRLAIFRVDPEARQLVDVSDPDSALLFTPPGQSSDETTTAYGIALWRDPASGKQYAFVNRRATGDLAQFELVATDAGTVSWRQVRAFSLPIPEGGELADAQTEGMVADAELGFLYIAQENVGIWKVEAAPDSSEMPRLIHAVAPKSDYLEADAEGLTIYYAAGGKGYLLASSQGASTFAAFTREGDNTYLGSFQVGRSGEVDGVQESDGAMVMSLPLGDRFPQGLLVVHDGFNDPAFMVEDDGELENASTNFKFVPWEQVAAAFSPPLVIDTTSYGPRP